MADPVNTPTENDELAALVHELNGNPATRGEFLRMVKKVRPALPIPELDNADAVQAVRDELQGKFDAFAQQSRQAELTRALNDRRAQIKQKYGFSDDDIAATEKLMTDGHIADYDMAAEHRSLQLRMSVPTPGRRERVKPFEGIDMDKFVKDPEGAALDQMYSDLDALRDGRLQIQ